MPLSKPSYLSRTFLAKFQPRLSSSEDEKQMDHLFRDAFLVATENYGYTVQLELHQPEVFTWGRRREVEAVHPFHLLEPW